MTAVALVALSLIPAQQFCGFSVSSFQNPQNQHKKIEKPTNYMSNTKSNPDTDTLIASFLLPWKVTNHSTGKEQPNNHKKPCAWILPVLQCLQNPRGLSLFQGNFSQNFSNFSNFSTFRFFRFFRLFEPKSPGMWTFRLFDFSRANIVIFTVWPIPARRAHSGYRDTPRYDHIMQFSRKNDDKPEDLGVQNCETKHDKVVLQGKSVANW